MLVVVDDGARENLSLVPDPSISGARVACGPDAIITVRGISLMIVSDNDIELTSLAFLWWTRECHVDRLSIEPGKPQQNGYVESFNGRPARRVLQRDAVRVAGACTPGAALA